MAAICFVRRNGGFTAGKDCVEQFQREPGAEEVAVMDASKKTEAKQALDRLIDKQRVALYKPIQVAEILYRVRLGELSVRDIRYNPESYRNPSKRWRDSVTRLLIDQVSTSSQKYQDNLFEPNAIPPETLAVLAEENLEYPGVVERYIYQQFRKRQQQILRLWESLRRATPERFDLDEFLKSFTSQRGTKRSIDKAFEIVVYALFDTLVRHLGVTVTLAIDADHMDLLRAFEDFARLVLGIDTSNPSICLDARLYRAGVTNAADRGLDMWANFGPIVQVKHLTLTDELADEICEGVQADRIVIVCKDGEKEVLERVCQQLGQRIQGIIVQSQLAHWYEVALRGDFAALLGKDLLGSLRREFQGEFPYSKTFKKFLSERGYSSIRKCPSIFWSKD